MVDNFGDERGGRVGGSGGVGNTDEDDAVGFVKVRGVWVKRVVIGTAGKDDGVGDCL